MIINITIDGQEMQIDTDNMENFRHSDSEFLIIDSLKKNIVNELFSAVLGDLPCDIYSINDDSVDQDTKEYAVKENMASDCLYIDNIHALRFSDNANYTVSSKNARVLEVRQSGDLINGLSQRDYLMPAYSENLSQLIEIFKKFRQNYYSKCVCLAA